MADGTIKGSNLLYVFWTQTCGSALQVLWEHVEPSQNGSVYNGVVEAASSLLSR